jgi:hypothetical protein
MNLNQDTTKLARNQLLIYQIAVAEPPFRRPHFSLLYEHTTSDPVGGRKWEEA